MAQEELDILAIQALLPHRYPFLFVDRILELESRLSGLWASRMSPRMNNFFKGIFLDNLLCLGSYFLR